MCLNQWTSFLGVEIPQKCKICTRKPSPVSGYKLLNRFGFDTAHVFLTALSNSRNISTLKWDETMAKAHISISYSFLINMFLDKYVKKDFKKSPVSKYPPQKKGNKETPKKPPVSPSEHIQTLGARKPTLLHPDEGIQWQSAWTLDIFFWLVVSTNPSEKYSSNGEIFPKSGWKYKIFELPPPSFHWPSVWSTLPWSAQNFVNSKGHDTDTRLLPITSGPPPPPYFQRAKRTKIGCNCSCVWSLPHA